MKILQLVSNPGIGGTESFIVGLIPKLRAFGLDVHLANMWDGGGDPIKLCAPLGIPCHTLNYGQRRFRSSAPWKLRRFLKQERFDLVMAYGLRTTLLLRFAARYRNRPVLVTGLRGMDDWRKSHHVWIDRLTDRWMDHYIGVSRAVCRIHVSRERVNPAKMLYIPNGIDTEHFNRSAKPAWPSRAELGLPPGRLCVSVAHLRGVKGHPFQMDAITRAIAGGLGDDVRFAWVGYGVDEQLLKQMVAEKGLADRILFTGEARDVRPILANADMFFLSSREEGMPRGLMEAMAMGVAPMATKVGGIPEVLRDGVDGVLVPYGDADTTAASLRRMLDSPELRSGFAASAARRIGESFSFDAVARKYADLYTRLIARDPTVTRDYGFEDESHS